MIITREDIINELIEKNVNVKANPYIKNISILVGISIGEANIKEKSVLDKIEKYKNSIYREVRRNICI